MALDPEHKRAFLACEGNELMTVFDLEKHRPIAFLPLAKGPDVVKYDAGLKRIYVACYSGAISVFQEDDPNHFRKLGDFPVPKEGAQLGGGSGYAPSLCTRAGSGWSPGGKDGHL
jgi:hypothetical protein